MIGEPKSRLEMSGNGELTILFVWKSNENALRYRKLCSSRSKDTEGTVETAEMCWSILRY